MIFGSFAMLLNFIVMYCRKQTTSAKALHPPYESRTRVCLDSIIGFFPSNFSSVVRGGALGVPLPRVNELYPQCEKELIEKSA